MLGSSKSITLDLADVDDDSVCASQDSSGASLTLNGADVTSGVWTADDGLPHLILITDTGTDDQRTATFTFTGTDQNNQALTEAIAGPNSGATAATTKYFKTVTSITITSGVATATAKVGTQAANGAAALYTMLNRYTTVGARVVCDINGTINFTVQECFEDIRGGVAPNWIAITALATKTADTVGQASSGATAIRVVVNSYSSGADVTARVVQSETSQRLV